MAEARDPNSMAVPITPSMLLSMAVMEIFPVIGKEAGSNHGEDILITSNILSVTTRHQDPLDIKCFHVNGLCI